MSRFIQKVIWGLGRRYGKYLPGFRKIGFFKTLEQLANCYLYYFQNHFYDFYFNGEEEIVKRLNLEPDAIVFDIGAHHGAYANLVLEKYPSAKLHLFEMNPKNLAILKTKNSQISGVQIHAFGLSSRQGDARMIQYNEDGQISSLHDLGAVDQRKSRQEVLVAIRRGDDVLNNLNISEVKFMKIDTEGHDLEVLKGFEKALSDKKIHVLQFEYNETSIGARIFLKDFYEYLEPKGYKIGRIYPRGVEFISYDTTLENHRGSNWLACANDAFADIFRPK